MAKLSSVASEAAETGLIGPTSTIIYGAPKAGKSLLAGELAEFFDLIWVDMENGHSTLFQLPPSYQERIELIRLKDTRSYPIAIETVLKMVKGPVSICEEHGKVSCMICKKVSAPETAVNLPALGPDTIVVFDSLTQLTNSAISSITRNMPDDYKLDFDDWGNLGKLLDIFLSHVQQAGYHVVVISHEAEVETEGKKKTLVPVGGTRNFSRNVGKYFSHVIYAERKNRKHVFSSGTCCSSTMLTGSRTSVELENATKASLLAIYKPDVYAERNKMSVQDVKTATGASAQSGGTAKDILARLKKS